MNKRKLFLLGFFLILGMAGCHGPQEATGSGNMSSEKLIQIRQHMTRAMTLYSNGQVDASMEQALVAHQLDPKNPNIMEFIGFVYTRKSDDTKAVTWYRRALDQSKDNPELLADTGLCYYRMGELQKALEYFTLAHGLEPDNPVPLGFLCEIYFREQDFDTAMYYIRKWHQTKSKGFKTRLAKEDWYLITETDRKIQMYQRTIQTAYRYW